MHQSRPDPLDSRPRGIGPGFLFHFIPSCFSRLLLQISCNHGNGKPHRLGFSETLGSLMTGLLCIFKKMQDLFHFPHHDSKWARKMTSLRYKRKSGVPTPISPLLYLESCKTDIKPPEGHCRREIQRPPELLQRLTAVGGFPAPSCYLSGLNDRIREACSFPHSRTLPVSPIDGETRSGCTATTAH